VAADSAVASAAVAAARRLAALSDVVAKHGELQNTVEASVRRVPFVAGSRRQ